MRKRRILVLMHEDLVPPDDPAGLGQDELARIKTEYDVCAGLAALGHEVQKLGVVDELRPLGVAIKRWQPHLVFNLLEEFLGEAFYDHAVVGYLELLRQPYTGCNPRGLMLSRDKALSKKVLHYHRIRVPAFRVVPMGRRMRLPRGLDFPVIVKSLIEEASLGIARASVVDSEAKLAERVRFVHEQLHTDAIVEQFIAGRELYVGVLGNRRLTTLPVWELHLDKLPANAPRIATRRVKWDERYQDKYEIDQGPAEGLPPGVERRLQETSKRIYRLLGLSGYARIDFRMDAAGRAYFLEANPNPEIAEDGEFAAAAAAAGFDYGGLLGKVVTLGMSWAERH